MSYGRAIRENLEVVEEAYEFMLAYAAQGRTDEAAGPDGAHIRIFVRRFADAALAMEPQITALINAEQTDATAFAGSFKRDADTVLAVMQVLLSRDNISSEMIDNTNGMIAMRSYLTTLFFIDKVMIQ